MIKVNSFRPMEKGSLKGIASIEVEKWKLQINDICVFEMNGRRWISMPSRKVERGSEKPTYFTYIRFTDREIDNRFQTAFFVALDEWKVQNPEIEAYAPKLADDHNQELPF